MVNRLHRHSGQIGHLARQRFVEHLRSLAIREENRAVCKAIVPNRTLYRVISRTQQVRRAHLTGGLCDRNKVRDPRAGVQRDHVRRHSALNILCNVVHLASEHFLPATVRAGFLSCKVIDILVQIGNIAAHARVFLVKQLFRVINILVVNVLRLLVAFEWIQRAVFANLVDFLPGSVIGKPIPNCILQCAQVLNAVRKIDNVTGRLYISVKPGHRVKLRQFTVSVQQVAEPLLTRVAVVCNAGNRSRKIERAVRLNAEFVQHARKFGVRLVYSKMRRIVLEVSRHTVPHAVCDQGIAELVVHIVVNGAEFRNAVCDTFLQLARYLDFLRRDIVRSGTVLTFQHHLHKCAFVLA